MKNFCFTIDDNIRFLKEITEQNLDSLFSHPYVAMLRRLHERFGVKIQLNLFYRMEQFDLSQMIEKYKNEWLESAGWLKLSFHSDFENVSPYANSDYAEVFGDCHKVNEQILRFASPASLAKTTTIHYCQTTADGVRALADSGIQGLLGLFGSPERPMMSYDVGEEAAVKIRNGAFLSVNGMSYAAIDMVINSYKKDAVLPTLTPFLSRQLVCVMIHEQYFYEDYIGYQADFEEKLALVFEFLSVQGYQSCFFEELICHKYRILHHKI